MDFFTKTAMIFSMLFGSTMPVKGPPVETGKTAYDFGFERLTGEPMPLSEFKGNVLLVVNTASKCGLTPQYDGLEALYNKYKDRGLLIIGVPANDFAGQEPGTNEQIAEFCKLNYGVSFPMAAKTTVIGNDAHPFYLWAQEVLGEDATPKWNFHKYLVNQEGKLVNAFGSRMKPEDESISKAIEELL